MRYIPGDVYDSIYTMEQRTDGMGMLQLGADGVFRALGLLPPDFREPYVVDYRQLDRDQLRQYISVKTATRPSWDNPIKDLENLPDSRDVVDGKQLWEPKEELDSYRRVLDEGMPVWPPGSLPVEGDSPVWPPKSHQESSSGVPEEMACPMQCTFPNRPVDENRGQEPARAPPS